MWSLAGGALLVCTTPECAVLMVENADGCLSPQERQRGDVRAYNNVIRYATLRTAVCEFLEMSQCPPELLWVVVCAGTCACGDTLPLARVHCRVHCNMTVVWQSQTVMREHATSLQRCCQTVVYWKLWTISTQSSGAYGIAWRSYLCEFPPATGIMHVSIIACIHSGYSTTCEIRNCNKPLPQPSPPGPPVWLLGALWLRGYKETSGVAVPLSEEADSSQRGERRVCDGVSSNWLKQ